MELRNLSRSPPSPKSNPLAAPGSQGDGAAKSAEELKAEHAQQGLLALTREKESELEDLRAEAEALRCVKLNLVQINAQLTRELWESREGHEHQEAEWNTRMTKLMRKESAGEEATRRQVNDLVVHIGRIEAENEQLRLLLDGEGGAKLAARLLLPHNSRELEKLLDTSLVRLPRGQRGAEATPVWKLRGETPASASSTVVVFHGSISTPDGGAREALYPGTIELRANVVALEADKEAVMQANARLKRKLAEATAGLEAAMRSSGKAELIARVRGLEKELAGVQEDKEEADARAEVNHVVKKHLAEALQKQLADQSDARGTSREPLDEGPGLSFDSFEEEMEAVLEEGGSLL